MIKQGFKALPSGLSGDVISNINRFLKKIPSNSKDSVNINVSDIGLTSISAKSDGIAPGSSAIYTKTIDPQGVTQSYTKTTYDPSGNIVHTKDKLNPGRSTSNNRTNSRNNNGQ